MLGVISDTLVVAAAGIITATIGGAFAFAGVLVNARQQTRPPKAVTVEPDDLAELRAEILDRDHQIRQLTADRDHWRTLALQWVPQRRYEDPDGRSVDHG